jgi:hypothetical protein
VVDRAGDSVAALGSALPHNRHPDVGAFAVAPALAVGADGPVAERTPAGCFLAGWHEGIIERMSETVTELTPCLCGCGALVKGQWKRGHASRGVGGYRPDVHDPPRLPDPGEDYDLGEIYPEGDWQPGLDEPEPGEAGPPPELPPDEPAAPIPRGGKPRRGRQQAKPQRVTAAIRGDIEAKLGLMLTIPGNVWAIRDPVCGGTFMQSEPRIRAATLELVLQSPDLIQFFIGAGGGFMLWLNLLTACQPVLVTIWAHHVAHSIEAAPAEPERQYAA